MGKLLFTVRKALLMVLTVLTYWAALVYTYMTYTLTQLPYMATGHYFDGNVIYDTSYVPRFVLITALLFALATLLNYGVYRTWRKPRVHHQIS